MKTSPGALRLGLVLASALSLTLPASAATYLPVPDSELVENAPVVVRATVLGTATHLEPIAGANRPVTLVTLQVVEAFKDRRLQPSSCGCPAGGSATRRGGSPGRRSSRAARTWC